MALGRKKGASKAKGKKQLSLGDLVLAKVKGHPFWSAKVSAFSLNIFQDSISNIFVLISSFFVPR